jgi:hypothetical protein
VARPRDGRQQLVLRASQPGSRLLQDEAAGAVGAFRRARREAGLAEEGGLLIAGNPGVTAPLESTISGRISRGIFQIFSSASSQTPRSRS